MHIGTKLKRIDFTYYVCVLTFFDVLANLVPRNRGTTDICLPNVNIQWLKCLVRPIQVNLMTYLQQRRMMLVVESLSSVIPSIA